MTLYYVVKMPTGRKTPTQKKSQTFFPCVRFRGEILMCGVSARCRAGVHRVPTGRDATSGVSTLGRPLHADAHQPRHRHTGS